MIKYLFGSPIGMYGSEIAKRLQFVGLLSQQKQINVNNITHALEYLKFFEENYEYIMMEDEEIFNLLADTYAILGKTYYSTDQQIKAYKDFENKDKKIKLKLQIYSKDYSKITTTGQAILKTPILSHIIMITICWGIIIGFIIWGINGKIEKDETILILIGSIFLFFFPLIFKPQFWYCNQCNKQIQSVWGKPKPTKCPYCKAEF